VGFLRALSYFESECQYVTDDTDEIAMSCDSSLSFWMSTKSPNNYSAR
jgi:hypothetical protein